MNGKRYLLAITGLTLSIGLSSAVAGEPKVRQFGDWTVTITPKNARQSSSEPLANAAKKREVKSIPTERNDRRILIRPISFEQTVVLNDEPVAQPALAPVPQAVAPAPAVVENAPAPIVADPVAVPVVATPVPAVVQPAVSEPVPARKASAVPSLSPTPESVPPAPVLSATSKAPCENCGLPIITPKLRDHDEVPPTVVPQTANYRDVYFSIPFNRAEYDANPSYRHDATMEFLFNQLRPTVIQRGTTNVNHFDRGYGYGYDGYGGGWDPPYYPFSYGLRLHRSR